ncbi:MAG: hypothetical protein EOM67_12865 [Spirochaetia bacterium]|nr:hypothetical protein [Spirochaetia bacterium]
MKANVKAIRIFVPSEAIANKIKATPALKRLTRQTLKAGDNYEVVNHKQFSDIQRLLPIIGCNIYEVQVSKNNKVL